MANKTIYFVRHGETLFNKLGKIQGACDSPLTERGIKQAGIAKRYFEEEGIHFDAAYSSTQERASDTLELITDQPYERLKGIKEWNFGLYEGEAAHLVPRDQFETYFAKFGGDDQDSFVKRLQVGLDTIINENSGQHVLAVTHGITLKVIYELFKDHNAIPEEYVGPFPNCVVLKYEYNEDDKSLSLVEIVEHDFSTL